MEDGKIVLVFMCFLLTIFNTWVMFKEKEYKASLLLAFFCGFIFNTLSRMLLGVS
jgi:predicted neutral ceramidase superfamily lipid hydrolase